MTPRRGWNAVLQASPTPICKGACRKELGQSACRLPTLLADVLVKSSAQLVLGLDNERSRRPRQLLLADHLGRLPRRRLPSATDPRCDHKRGSAFDMSVGETDHM
jgi:hypothetical protein